VKQAAKPVLAQRMIARALQAGVRFGWVIGDEAHGVDGVTMQLTKVRVDRVIAEDS
jgi:SRSO17 transposase